MDFVFNQHKYSEEEEEEKYLYINYNFQYNLYPCLCLMLENKKRKIYNDKGDNSGELYSDVSKVSSFSSIQGKCQTLDRTVS